MHSYEFVSFPQNRPLEEQKPRRKQNTKTINSASGAHNDQHRAACTPYSTLRCSEDSRSLYIFHRLPIGCGKLSNVVEQGM